MSSKKGKKDKKQKKEKKSVYILLTRTETVPSRVIHFFKRMPYVHVSIALDEELDELYSFARKKVNNPFRCGFIDEDINSGIFGRDTETRCKVMRLRLTEQQYQDVKASIEVFKSNREKYKYNYLGVLSIYFHLGFSRKYKCFCSEFVDKVLKMSGINLFDKGSARVIPDDFRTCELLETTFEGRLQSYRDYLHSDMLAMDNVE
ncbi:hypothetical protein SAMN04487934_101258 [Eubacterium ruminantium]|nr:hypothetical protein SAMN04487934_101258 [Eubacterium ruminantium]